MCNFIIRPIKCYATVDIESDNSDSMNPIKAGDAMTVKGVYNDQVTLVRDNDTIVRVDISTFVHTFSDKDPNEKKDSKKS